MEIAGLCVLLFALPTMRGPRHMGFAILLLGALGTWIFQKHFFIRKPKPFEWLLILICIFTFISAAVNLPSNAGIRGCKDTFRFCFLAWLMFINTYTFKQILTAICFLTAGLFFGLIWGGYDLLTGITLELQLNAVGVVTHSSLFVATAGMVMFSLVLDNSGQVTKPVKYIFLFCFVLTFICLFIMASRATIFGVLVTLLLISPFLIKNKFFIFSLSAGILLTTALLLILFQFYTKSPVTERVKHIVSSRTDPSDFSVKLTKSDQIRHDNWIAAWAQITGGGKFFFGVGPGNFRYIDFKSLKYETPPVHIVEENIIPVHAHNIYLNKWAEEGIIGLIIFIVFQLYVIYKFIQYLPRNHQLRWEWITGVSVFLISTVKGQFHSAFYAENAWLSMILIGLSLAAFRQMEEQNHHPSSHRQVFA